MKFDPHPSELSYPDHPDTLDHVKGGILLGSLTAALLACVVLGIRNAHHRGASADDGVESVR